MVNANDDEIWDDPSGPLAGDDPSGLDTDLGAMDEPEDITFDSHSMASHEVHDPEAQNAEPSHREEFPENAHEGPGEWQADYLRDIGSVVIGGDPDADLAHWSPALALGTCAIAAQKGVLESLLGRSVPSRELHDLAVRKGWHDPETGGTYGDDIGKLLEEYGIQVERSYQSSLTDLYDALQRGEKVLVGLDGREIWSPVRGPGGAPLELPHVAHIVWVTGIEFDDAGRVQVIVNDPGAGAGRTVVDSADFLNAWADFGNFTVIAHRPGSGGSIS